MKNAKTPKRGRAKSENCFFIFRFCPPRFTRRWMVLKMARKDIRQKINASTAKKSFCEQIVKRDEGARKIYEEIDQLARETEEIVIISVRSEMGRRYEEIKTIRTSITRARYDASKSAWFAGQVQRADVILNDMRIVLSAARQRKEAIDRAVEEMTRNEPERLRSDRRNVNDGIRFARAARSALCEIRTHPDVAYRIVGVSPTLAMAIADMISRMDIHICGSDICVAAENARQDFRIKHLFDVPIPESPNIKITRDEVLRLIIDVAGSFPRGESVEGCVKAAMAKT